MLLGSVLTTAFAGGAGVTGILNIIIKLILARGKAKAAYDASVNNRSEAYIKIIKAQNERELSHPLLLLSGVLSRGFMLVVPMFTLVGITWWGAASGNVIMYPETGEPWSINLLGLLELTGSHKTTWTAIAAVPVFPIWMAMLGAEVAYHLTNGMFKQ